MIKTITVAEKAHLVALDSELITRCKKDRYNFNFALYRLKNAQTEEERLKAICDLDNAKTQIEQNRVLYRDSRGTDLYTDTERYLYNANNRTKRLRKKIAKMFETDFYLIFLTFNFKDEVLQDTSSSTRRTYVSRFLKENCIKYVANIDFGSSDIYTDRNGKERIGTEREHYHAIVVANKKIKYTNWKYGQLNGKKITRNDKSLTRLPLYITKLTNHAIKESTRQSKIIYSKKCKKDYTELMYEYLKEE